MTSMYRNTAIAGLVSLAAACVGELELRDPDRTTGGNSDSAGSPDAGTAIVPDEGEGEELFMQSVAPILMRCTGEACHAGTSASPLKFLGASTEPTSLYSSINQYPSVTGNYNPSLANLLLKIDPGNHENVRYSTEERGAIVQWLEAENADRTGDSAQGGETPTPTSGDPLAIWAGCMSYDDFEATDMENWDDKGSSEGACEACHRDGLARFNTNSDNETMFNMNRTELYIIGFFTVNVDVDGTQTVIPAYDKFERMGNGTTNHPRFNTNPDDAQMLSLQQFYDLTMQRLASGTCGPAQYYQP